MIGLCLLLCLPPAFAAEEILQVDLGVDDGGLVGGGTKEQWEWGDTTSGPEGGNSWGTILDGNYLHDSADWLMLPPTPLSGLNRPVLELSHWFEIETGGDHGTVVLDDGVSSSLLTPVYGYPEISGFTGESDGWRTDWFLLDGAGDLSDVRLLFESDASASLSGWYLGSLLLWDGDPIPPWVGDAEGPEDTQDLVGPYRVEARVADDVGLEAVRLAWSVGLSAPDRVDMVEVEPGLYAGEIPGMDPDTDVDWWIEASDAENETTFPEGEASRFRVYLAAPTDLNIPEGRVVGGRTSLDWAAPESPNAILGYRVYRDGQLLDEVHLPPAEVPLVASTQSVVVTALYDTITGDWEGDPSEALEIQAHLSTLEPLEPDQAYAGDTLRVSLSGSYLLLSEGEVGLELGAGVEVLEIEVESADRATALLSLSTDAPLGLRDLALSSGEVITSWPDAFEILDGADRPRLLSVDPDSLPQGEESTLVFLASEGPAATPLVDMGDGVVVEEVTVLGDQITVKVAVALDAPLGERAVELDDGARILSGVTVRIRDQAVAPSAVCSCSSGPGRSGGQGLLLVVAGLAAFSARGRRLRKPD